MIRVSQARGALQCVDRGLCSSLALTDCQFPRGLSRRPELIWTQHGCRAFAGSVAPPPTTRWKEAPDIARRIGGVRAGELSPGLVWAHGLGSSCAVDDARGIGYFLSPRVLGGRTVLRLDLRGRGRSAAAHEPDRGPEQYTWDELAKDLRVCAHGGLSRAFFGGEGSGAAVALHAAIAAHAAAARNKAAAVDAPPGLVLMRPPALLLAEGDDSDNQRQRAEYEAAAADLEAAVEDSWEISVEDLHGGGIAYGAPDDVPNATAEQRRNIQPNVLAAALRGQAASSAPAGFSALGGGQAVDMAADAYGVPQMLRCPVLILAMPGDAAHPVDAAERLAKVLPDAELCVAADAKEARETWSKRIQSFLKDAWMKEFLAKRVMPQ